jgi:DNA-directed RNA polymerase subunit K/omega
MMNIDPNKTPNTTVIRDIRELSEKTGNLYASLAIISKRSNQLAIQIKEELNAKLEEFASETDNLEEVFENREQIEISKYYEQLPKPTLMATQEFLEGKVYHRIPAREQDDQE